MKMTGHDRQADAGSAEVGGVLFDQDQFAQAFEDRRPHLQRVCQRILGEPDGAQDAVNETYLRAYGNLAQFEPGNFPGWLSRIAKRICLDRIRKELPVQRLVAENEPGSTDSEVRIINAIQIRSILAKLPEPLSRSARISGA